MLPYAVRGRGGVKSDVRWDELQTRKGFQSFESPLCCQLPTAGEFAAKLVSRAAGESPKRFETGADVKSLPNVQRLLRVAERLRLPSRKTALKRVTPCEV
jgi:hypothetical protein